MTKLANLKQRLLENPDTRKEYAQANAEFSLIEGMIRAGRYAEATGHQFRVGFV